MLRTFPKRIGIDDVFFSLATLYRFAYILDFMLQILESNLFRLMRMTVQATAHGTVDGINIVQNGAVIGLCAVCQIHIVFKFLRLVFTDKITKHINQSVSLSLGDKLG